MNKSTNPNPERYIIKLKSVCIKFDYIINYILIIYLLLIKMKDNTLYLILLFEKNPIIDTLKHIISEYRKENLSINHLYNGSYSLLHIKQPYETMKYLLNNNGDPNCEGSYELKPIHFQYDYDTIKLLVERGAQPNPKDINNFNPLFWQKDPLATEYLLKYNEIYISLIIKTNNIHASSIYIKMLIYGGYDPYSENNISISPIFIQRDIGSIKILIKHIYNHNFYENLYDMAFETILFKPCITTEVIDIFKPIQGIYNHRNIIGNTALHVQYIDLNIIALLVNGADTTIKNNQGLTPYQYHFKRNNLLIANIIRRFSSAKSIQNCWRKFWFVKTYIPPKYYKVKKEFISEFIYLPPSTCHTFPGGIIYQNGHKSFNESVIIN